MENEHAGHRRRMAGRMANGCLCEYEVLEMLLYPIIPRKNTCDLAHRLLAAFGDISGVYRAQVEDLKKIRGIGDKVAQGIYALGEKFRTYAAPAVSNEKAPFRSLDFISYAKEEYAEIPYEVLDIYTLAKGGIPTNKLRYTDFHQRKVDLPTQDFNRLLLTEKPMAIVVVHNHLGEDPKPSEKDEHLTKCIQLICNMYGVVLFDHIICASDSAYSYYLSGRLSSISKNYAMNELIARGGEKIEC